VAEEVAVALVAVVAVADSVEEVIRPSVEVVPVVEEAVDVAELVVDVVVVEVLVSELERRFWLNPTDTRVFSSLEVRMKPL
jgi:hypothetical protein